MEDFLEITLDISKYYHKSLDIYANEKMRLSELVYETLIGLELSLDIIENIVIRVQRTGEIVTQSKHLCDVDIRNGDVLVLL